MGGISAHTGNALVAERRGGDLLANVGVINVIAQPLDDLSSLLASAGHREDVVEIYRVGRAVQWNARSFS